jgi:hypothetical protein
VTCDTQALPAFADTCCGTAVACNGNCNAGQCTQCLSKCRTDQLCCTKTGGTGGGVVCRDWTDGANPCG